MKTYKEFINEKINTDGNRLRDFYIKNLPSDMISILDDGEYFDDIEWIDDDTVKVYRFLAIGEDIVDKFKATVMDGNIGLYWTFRDDLGPVWGYSPYDEDGEKQEFRVTGHIKLSDIDFVNIMIGIEEEMDHFGTEKEIRGKDGSKNIKIVVCEEVENLKKWKNW